MIVVAVLYILAVPVSNGKEYDWSTLLILAPFWIVSLILGLLWDKLVKRKLLRPAFLNGIGRGIYFIGINIILLTPFHSISPFIHSTSAVILNIMSIVLLGIVFASLGFILTFRLKSFSKTGLSNPKSFKTVLGFALVIVLLFAPTFLFAAFFKQKPSHSSKELCPFGKIKYDNVLLFNNNYYHPEINILLYSTVNDSSSNFDKLAKSSISIGDSIAKSIIKIILDNSLLHIPEDSTYGEFRSDSLASIKLFNDEVNRLLNIYLNLNVSKNGIYIKWNEVHINKIPNEECAAIMQRSIEIENAFSSTGDSLYNFFSLNDSTFHEIIQLFTFCQSPIKAFFGKTTNQFLIIKCDENELKIFYNNKIPFYISYKGPFGETFKKEYFLKNGKLIFNIKSNDFAFSKKELESRLINISNDLLQECAK
jgi:hypothetical protein